jgi:hypothetical protein
MILHDDLRWCFSLRPSIVQRFPGFVTNLKLEAMYLAQLDFRLIKVSKNAGSRAYTGASIPTEESNETD